MNVQRGYIFGTYTQNIYNSSTCSHPSEEENRTIEIAAKIASLNALTSCLTYVDSSLPSLCQ